jgi:gamma-glutamyltranspeptidase / glutathione hydrolase
MLETGVRMLRRLIGVCLLALWTSAAFALETTRAPEAPTGETAKTLAVATKHMIVAANPMAAEAGREILRQGGSAVDAAIATQLVLGLVEPQSSGLGGGAFVVTWDSASKQVQTYDGRETAPASAKPDRFLREGKPMDFADAVHSGLSVGVPGVSRVLELMHAKHGKLTWAKLFEPAIKLAENGFPLTERTHRLLALEKSERFPPQARDYFYDAGGQPKAAGTLIKNPDYAATLKALAAGGAKVFYEGQIADAMVAAVAGAPIAIGDLTLTDLAGYQAKERPPLCVAYRLRKICGMGPPSSGALAVAQTLKLIEPFAEVQGEAARMSAPALHVIGEAEKLAYADRNRYIADPDVVPQPGGLLDAAYLNERRKLINAALPMAKPQAGLPPGLAKRTFGEDQTHEAAGTSHISIVDDNGNAVSMTTTIESAFGSHLWAAGFLLNNQLTDFSFLPADSAGMSIANAVAGGKRPRSSMAPTLFFDDKGALEGVTGSPGGSRIILFVIKALVAMLDWNMNAQEAAALVNFGSEGSGYQLEIAAGSLVPALKLMTYGHAVNADPMTSGVHTILRRNGHLEGGADPRREGAALGD